MGEYNELYHHGVKGQKWGVRRTPEQLGDKTSSEGSSKDLVSDIKFETKKWSDGRPYLSGKTSFGNNDNCMVVLDTSIMLMRITIEKPILLQKV